MANFKKLSQERYSVRGYLPKEIEKEKIEYIIECARLAPSAANKQPWIFYIVSSEEGKNAIKEVYHREWFKTAPLYIVVCADKNQSWKRSEDNKNHSEIDAAIAAEHICLAAHDIGLGTCWICNYKSDILRVCLNLPEENEPIVVFSIGYIDEEKSKKTDKNRKPVSEITKWI